MSKERYNKIIDEAYDDYYNSIEKSEYDGFGPISIKLPTLTQEEFTNKIKTDNEFSEMWGLKIEERVLDFDERKKLMDEYTDSRNMFRIGFQVTLNGINYERYNEVCDKYNIPSKEIRLEYKNETVNYYE